jgi:DNA uptake protein ComE-like DNA-binding protein
MSVNPLQNPIPPGTLAHLAPVDSFDFTPLSLPSAANPMQFTAIHYARSNPGNTIPNTAETPLSQPTALMKATFWKFVYPGRWNPGGLYQVPTNVDNTTAAFLARQEGIAVSSWDANGINSSPKAKYTDNWSDYTGAYALGTPQFQGTPSGKAYVQKIAFTTATGTPPLTTPPLAIPFSWQAYGTYPNAFPPIQLNNTDWGGPTKVYTTAANPPGNMFPFGGFARVGDVLQVPYIGSYTIFDSTGNNLIEMNSITRDAALADDTDGPGSAAALTPGADDPVEQIGRFCPLLATQQPLSATGSYSGTPPESYIPLANPANPAAQPGFDPYAWAAHIFDYFSTLQNPQDDYLPNTDPQLYVSATGAWNPATAAWVANPALVPAFAILNSATGFANQASVEDIAPVEGLINVNTASMQTLSAVPFLPGDMPKIGGANVLAPVGTNPGSNQGIAASIITYRNTYGPIKTLFDLNRVLLTQGTYQKTGNPAATPTTFQNFYGDPTLYDYDNYNGSLSPLGTNYSGVTNDFKSRFNMLTRVSNLLTTRSDTYTVYILVQGWTGVGTTAPQMVAQRRAAFIADRSRVTGTNRTLAIYPIQTN